jgi:hypothetical protein
MEYMYPAFDSGFVLKKIITAMNFDILVNFNWSIH